MGKGLKWGPGQGEVSKFGVVNIVQREAHSSGIHPPKMDTGTFTQCDLTCEMETLMGSASEAL